MEKDDFYEKNFYNAMCFTYNFYSITIWMQRF